MNSSEWDSRNFYQASLLIQNFWKISGKSIFVFESMEDKDIEAGREKTRRFVIKLHNNSSREFEVTR